MAATRHKLTRIGAFGAKSLAGRSLLCILVLSLQFNLLFSETISINGRHNPIVNRTDSPDTELTLNQIEHRQDLDKSDEDLDEKHLKLLDDDYLDPVPYESLKKLQKEKHDSHKKISNFIEKLELAKAKSISKQNKRPHGSDGGKSDWWSNMKKLLVKTKQETTARPQVYREQPLEQNQILTARNQLRAIKEKHKLLLNRSLPQLVRLDQKLIDTYKSCFRSNHPLYGGMLYRARGFLLNLGREIKQERQLLEGLVKRAQKILKSKIENKTLVLEYQSLADQTQPTSVFQAMEIPAVTNETSTDGETPTYLKDLTDLKTSSTIHQHDQETPELRKTWEFLNNQNTRNQAHELTKTGRSGKDTLALGSGKYLGVARGNKQGTYNVHIDEVNLKRRLKKTQALIDRVSESTSKLNGIIDDIVFLLKLSPDIERRNIYSKPNINS